MARASRDFQVFVKPVGPECNLGCSYCYYLGKPSAGALGMADEVLEEYIRGHIAAAPGPEVSFSWHGGEPTLLGIDYFQRILALQKKHLRPGMVVSNGIQTNGTLLDGDWGRFLAGERFAVGLSLDGPPEVHDRHRLTKTGGPTHARVMRGYEILQRHGIYVDLLAVVGAHSVARPLEVYDFFQGIDARFLTFLPLVVRTTAGVSPDSVSARAWGDFLCAVFDRWKARDVGRIKVQIFEEAARPALGLEHSLCLFRPECGDIPVVEQNAAIFIPATTSSTLNICWATSWTGLWPTFWKARPNGPSGGSRARACPNTAGPAKCWACVGGNAPATGSSTLRTANRGLTTFAKGIKNYSTTAARFSPGPQPCGTRSRPRLPARRRSPKKPPKVGRNAPCPCGSGRKYKKCCLGKSGR